MNTLEHLKQSTTIVADTGDFEAIGQFTPQDATTNPSLILKAIQTPRYSGLLEQITQHQGHLTLSEQTDQLLVKFGLAILDMIPGRVSTEVDARLSFDTTATILQAQRIIHAYEQAGIHKKRVLIKIAATWEGIQAARILETQGIACNLTLVFSMVQAVACARADVTLISPFVGRIYDWTKQWAGGSWDEEKHSGACDPGVISVRRIYAYYKQNSIKTAVMGASFRNTGQILALSGCDLLTISPELLKQLQSQTILAPAQLNEAWAQSQPREIYSGSEASFRFDLNQDAMASEKLSEGIRLFVADTIKLDQLLSSKNPAGTTVPLSKISTACRPE